MLLYGRDSGGGCEGGASHGVVYDGKSTKLDPLRTLGTKPNLLMRTNDCAK